MSNLILKLLIIVIPYMNKWSDEQLTTFCMVLDPYIKSIGWEESNIDENELINFLEDTIRMEEDNKGAGNE